MSAPTLRPGGAGHDVAEMQILLQDRLKLDPPLRADGHYGPLTLEAVYAFQASHVGPDGRPLTVDGIVGPVTWWALKTSDQTSSTIDGFHIGAARHELGAVVIDQAVKEARSGARERGQNNAGSDVARYLAPVGRAEGAWCAGFASYCVYNACRQLGIEPPFKYSGTARGILSQLEEVEEPQAGDLAFWWRVAPTSWQGHVEIVTKFENGVVWTIGGNRGRYPAPVQQFSYVVEREAKMLGFAML